MRTILIVVVIVTAISAALIVGCKSDEQSASQGEGVISGYVTDGNSALPLSGVAVTAQLVSGGSDSKTTDIDGRYSMKFTIDSTTGVALSLVKSAYNRVDTVITLIAGSVTQVNTAMNPTSVIVPPGGGGSGTARTIAFLGANPSEVRVFGVGGQETSILSWEVRDSLGLPIDALHAVDLTFSMFGGPNGGEYISPPTVRTNAVGRAYTTFNAGIKSGVVQVVATATVSGRPVMSSPTKVIINAGFPDQAHFTVAAERYNFAAMDWVGRRDPISVLVGDKYSNPVNQGTAVYFRSSAGVIQPSVYTDKDGQGTVNLISGNPYPIGRPYAAAAPYDTSYHWVVARTVGDSGVVVQDSVFMLWTGQPRIWPPTPSAGFQIPNGGSLSFTFAVSDRYYHPLASGTTVAVTAEVPQPPPGFQADQVLVGFGLQGSIKLRDYILPGPGTTDFSFTLSDGNALITSRTPVTVTIWVTGPNGDAYYQFGGALNVP